VNVKITDDLHLLGCDKAMGLLGVTSQKMVSFIVTVRKLLFSGIEHGVLSG
jgi:hypothetical protein